MSRKRSGSMFLTEGSSKFKEDAAFNTHVEKEAIRSKRLRDGSYKLSSKFKTEATSEEVISTQPANPCILNSDHEKSTFSKILPHSAVPNHAPNSGTSHNTNAHKISQFSGKSPNITRRNETEAARLKLLRKKLPIWSKRKEICDALKLNDVLLLKADTGSGKSTQVPQFLCTQSWCQKKNVEIEDNFGIQKICPVGGIIAVTQPRRVAAITLAHRVAQETGSVLQKGNRRYNGLVGYSVRFDKLTPIGIKIKFVTEGTLLQEMLQDPYLKQYSAIIVDEIHERSVDVDLIVGFLKTLVRSDKKGRGRVPLKVVIMSATMDLKPIAAFFTSAETHETLKLDLNPGKLIEVHSPESGINTENNSRQSPKLHTDLTSSLLGPNEQNGVLDSISKRRKMSDSTLSSAAIDTTIEGDIESRNVGELPFTNEVSMIVVEGRQFKVDIFYEPKPTSNYMKRMLQIILQIHIKEPLPGDILAFLTGIEEIENLRADLEGCSHQLAKSVPKIKVLALHGTLSTQDQQEAFEKTKQKLTRRVVLATNIAETSVTVPGVRFVVDCGKSKVKEYRPKLGLESLLAKPISKVSAIQRAGRAGREAEGKCFRLYTEADYNKLNDSELPEILRSDIVEAVLKMKARGVKDILSFPLMNPPNILAMEKALIRLYLMNALNDDGDLTEDGKRIARLPIPAPYGRVLIAVEKLEPDLILDIIDIISCLTTDSEIFLQAKSEEERETVEEFRRDIYRREGDIITALQTIKRYAAEDTDRKDWCRKRMISVRAINMAMQIRKQLRQIYHIKNILKDVPKSDPQPMTPTSPDNVKIILKMFLKAFATNTALMAPTGGYITIQGKNPITIHPSSVLYGQRTEAIMFLDHVFTTKSYARQVSAIEAPWILEALAM